MGDVAQTYFNVLNLKERHRIAQENLQSTEDLLKAVKPVFRPGAHGAGYCPAGNHALKRES